MLADIIAGLRRQAAGACRSTSPEYAVQIDVRYGGQEFSLPVPVTAERGGGFVAGDSRLTELPPQSARARELPGLFVWRAASGKKT